MEVYHMIYYTMYLYDKWENLLKCIRVMTRLTSSFPTGSSSYSYWLILLLKGSGDLSYKASQFVDVVFCYANNVSSFHVNFCVPLISDWLLITVFCRFFV